MRQVGHEDCADYAIGTVDQQVAAIACEADEDDDAVAEAGRVYGSAGLGFDDIDPSLGGTGDYMVA